MESTDIAKELLSTRAYDCCHNTIRSHTLKPRHHMASLACVARTYAYYLALVTKERILSDGRTTGIFISVSKVRWLLVRRLKHRIAYVFSCSIVTCDRSSRQSILLLLITVNNRTGISVICVRHTYVIIATRPRRECCVVVTSLACYLVCHQCSS